MTTAVLTNTEENYCVREKGNKISICTSERLNDDQMRELFWIALGMARSGKTLTEMLKGEETENGKAE